MIPRGQILIWMLLYAAAIPGAAGLNQWTSRGAGGFDLLWMVLGTLLPGLALAAFALIWPARWLWVPLTLLTMVHVALGLGFHPEIGL